MPSRHWPPQPKVVTSVEREIKLTVVDQITDVDSALEGSYQSVNTIKPVPKRRSDPEGRRHDEQADHHVDDQHCRCNWTCSFLVQHAESDGEADDPPDEKQVD